MIEQRVVQVVLLAAVVADGLLLRCRCDGIYDIVQCDLSSYLVLIVPLHLSSLEPLHYPVHDLCQAHGLDCD